MSQKQEFKRKKPETGNAKFYSPFSAFCVLFFVFCVLFSMAGCESLTRKFTRKSKKKDQSVQMVLVPEEYKGPDMTKEELYRQYFIYWKAWQDELINAFNQKASLKKKADCAEEALRNLVNMKMQMVPLAQKNFDSAIARLDGLLSSVRSDIYGSNDAANCRSAEQIKTNIERNFAYPKIRNYLK